jgi:hypothetical protein
MREFPTVKWKGTGKNGRRKNIGTGEVRKATEAMMETNMMRRSR